MRNRINLGLILFITCAVSSYSHADQLIINITGATANQGKVHIAIFNKASEFPAGTPIKLIRQTANIKSHKLELPKGRYAIAVFQDENNNQKLDLNFFKIPKEKTGTSGKRSFGKPKFSNAVFKLSKQNQQVSVHLK